MKYIFPFSILILIIFGLSSCSKENPVSADQTILPPTLLTPANGDTGIGSTPTLTWASVANANGYWLQVSGDSTFNVNIEFNYEGLVLNSKVLQELSPANKYFWRVKSLDEKAYSEWSKAWKFTTSAKPNFPPIEPVNPLPINGEVNILTPIVLSWDGGDPDSGDLVIYTVLLSTVNPPSSYLDVHESNLNVCRSNVNNLLGRKTYYWQIISKDNHANIRNGPVWSFTTLDPWVVLQEMPTARSYMTADTFSGKIFVIGGKNSSNQPLSLVELYDPISNSWSVKADMPTARYRQSMANLNGTIYVFGGYNDSVLHVVESYDPLLNTWTPKRPMPYAAFGQSATSYNGKIYLFGGVDGEGNPLPSMRYDSVKDTFEVFPQNGIYINTTRAALTHVESRRIFILSDDFYEYFPDYDITYEHSQPYIQYGSAALNGDRIFMVRDSYYTYVYDILSRNTFETTPPSYWGEGLSVIQVGGKIYTIGGGSKIVQVYDPTIDPGRQNDK
ncbi:MAG: kelch repeat-containing protein [Candidatus Edwardsbacteria bacterium]|nr:kelch repeat-containing protein [Candidatus Edwardsbacteria bacterium]